MQQNCYRNRLSYSHLTTFEKCPLQYRFRYIEKIPVPPSKHISFGNSIHSTIEQFQKLFLNGDYDIDAVQAESLLLEMLEKNWKSEGYESQTEELEWKEKAKRALRESFVPWISQQFKMDYRILSIEDWFEIPLENCVLVGKIDRIDFRVEEDRIYYRIVDFKTGEKVPMRMQNSEDTQLYVYTFGAEQIIASRLPSHLDSNGDYILEKIMYFYVVPNDEVENRIDATHKSLIMGRIYSQINSLLKAIEIEAFPARTGRHCNWCDFNRVCSAYSRIALYPEVPREQDDMATLKKMIEELESLQIKIVEKEREIYRYMKERGIEEIEHNGRIYRIVQES